MAVTPYYDRDGIVIYHGDCRDVLDSGARSRIADLREVRDGKAARIHVITDPPYESEAHTMGRRAAPPKNAGAEWSASDLSVARPVGFDAMSEELRRVSGQEMAYLATGWILVFCQVEAAMLWRDAICPPGRYVRTQIWRKPDGAPQFAGDRPGMGYESIVTCWGADLGRTEWNGGGRHGVYVHNVVHDGTGHQTEKPIGLMRDLVALFTNPGDIIVDPFMGSGTTLRAALDLGRYAVGIELDEGWCEVAAHRMAQMALPLDGYSYG